MNQTHHLKKVNVCEILDTVIDERNNEFSKDPILLSRGGLISLNNQAGYEKSPIEALDIRWILK